MEFGQFVGVEIVLMRSVVCLVEEKRIGEHQEG